MIPLVQENVAHCLVGQGQDRRVVLLSGTLQRVLATAAEVMKTDFSGAPLEATTKSLEDSLIAIPSACIIMALVSLVLYALAVCYTADRYHGKRRGRLCGKSSRNSRTAKIWAAPQTAATIGNCIIWTLCENTISEVIVCLALNFPLDLVWHWLKISR